MMNLPTMNIDSWTAAPWIAAPMIATNAVEAIPHFLPYLSGMKPANGVAATVPNDTIATLRESSAVER